MDWGLTFLQAPVIFNEDTLSKFSFGKGLFDNFVAFVSLKRFPFCLK